MERVSWPVYEWLWGKGWVSPGGLELTIELVEILFKQTSLRVPARDQMRVLDVHTGTGGFAFHMADRYRASVIGFDEKEDGGSLINTARTRALRDCAGGAPNFYEVDVLEELSRVDHANTGYHLIWCRQGFLHYTDAEKRDIFSRTPMLLRSGGVLGFTEFCKPSGPLSDRSGPFQHFIEARGSDLYSPSEYEQLLSKCLPNGFTHQSFDLSDRMIDQFHRDIRSLNSQQEEFVAEFGQDALRLLNVELKSRMSWLKQKDMFFVLF